ncbi:hypothetical protein GPA10_05160 [Streptomyces sp. p1417]|uniref:Uncharacterized protein n=1 Tax=Streptomyces typhae TaxID=2681492 RepID=A0A6L6WPK8_9ACTN|nr:hypothetical protein [Streptomyces typhae]MVO84175.1 hypothetical protein [Streptomyces typhae]
MTPAEKLDLYDRPPVADVDSSARYRKETSSDDGRTWEHPRQMTGKFLRHDMVDALAAGCAVTVEGGAAVIESPHPMGGWIRYTLIC